VASQLFTKHRNAFFGVLISVLAVLWIWKAVGFSGFGPAARQANYVYLIPCVLLILLTVVLYGLRWRQLLEGAADSQTCFVATLLSLGGNMFLPARAGDLLRLHHTREHAQLAWSDLLGRLVVEKIVDLFTIAAVGALAFFFLLHVNAQALGSSAFVLGTAIAVVLIAVGVAILKFAHQPLITVLGRVFGLLGLKVLFERHIVRLVASVQDLLTPRLLVLPVVTTLFLWLGIYAGVYIFAGRLLGIDLPYPEALMVLSIGTLGLMLPGAPSGLGTYHASVVSAFLILGRPAAEGLLLATVIHFLFFVVLGLPVVLLYLYWHVKRVRSAWSKNA